MRTTKQFILLKLLQQKGNWVSGDELAEELKLSRESIWKAINTLKRKGNQIESRKNLGYKYVGNDSLDEDTINFYSGMKFEDKIFVFDEVTSTQELAKQYLSSHEVKQPFILLQIIKRRDTVGVAEISILQVILDYILVLFYPTPVMIF